MSSSSHWVAKVLEFHLQHQSFQWIFRTDFLQDWLVWLLAVQGTVKSLLHTTVQNHQFFGAQHSYDPTLTSYMTTGKTIALTRWTFVGNVSVFDWLSRCVLAFLPRSKCLLISWLQSPSAVILEPRKIKSVTVSIVSPTIHMKWWDQTLWSSFFECWILSQLFHLIFHFHQEAL